jgi:hypothetical protein
MNWFNVLKSRNIPDPRKGKKVKGGLTEEQKKKYGWKSADAEYYRQKRIATAKEAQQDRLDAIIKDLRDSITGNPQTFGGLRRAGFNNFKQEYDENVKLRLDYAREQLKATEFFMRELEKNPEEYFINMKEAMVNDPYSGAVSQEQKDEYRKDIEREYNRENLEENIKVEKKNLSYDKKEAKEFIQKVKQMDARQTYEKILDEYDGSAESYSKVIEKIPYESRYPTHGLHIIRDKYYLKYFKGSA